MGGRGRSVRCRGGLLCPVWRTRDCILDVKRAIARPDLLLAHRALLTLAKRFVQLTPLRFTDWTKIRTVRNHWIRFSSERDAWSRTDLGNVPSQQLCLTERFGVVLIKHVHLR